MIIVFRCLIVLYLGLLRLPTIGLFQHVLRHMLKSGHTEDVVRRVTGVGKEL